MPSPEGFIQYGALGIVAYVVWWMTTRHSRIIDRLSDVIDRQTAVFRELTDAVCELKPKPARAVPLKRKAKR